MPDFTILKQHPVELNSLIEESTIRLHRPKLNKFFVGFGIFNIFHMSVATFVCSLCTRQDEGQVKYCM